MVPSSGRAAPRTLHLAPALYAAFFALLLPGCNVFGTGVERTETVRVVLEGGAAGGVEVITSMNLSFPLTDEGEVEMVFLEADTSVVGLPFDETYRLSETRQWGLRVQAPVEDSIVVDMTIFTGGRERFQRTNVLLDRGEPLEFSFTGRP